MKVLFAVWEIPPFFKVGGLGDVARALPAGLTLLGVEIGVVTPYYKAVRFGTIKKEKIGSFKVIYDGIDVNDFNFNDKPKDYLFWLSRVSPLKGIKEAALAAKRSDSKILLSGVISSDKAQLFFDRQVKPLLDEKRRFIGPCKHDKKNELYRNAKAFIFPITWEEPFGLVMIEAMACGTPVIAYVRGAVPEVIVDGKTGFIIYSSDSDKRGDWVINKTGIDGLVEAIYRINTMSKDEYAKMRLNCRSHVEKNFTVKKTVEGYERIYKHLVGKI